MKKIFSQFKKSAKEVVRVSFLPPEEVEKPEVLVRRKAILIAAFLFGTSLSLLIWILFAVQADMLQSDIKATAKEVAKIEETLKTKSQEINEVQSISARVISAKLLLERHIFWTNFFKFLEEETIPDVSYNSFTGDKKSVFLAGTAKNYEAIASQILIFKTSPFVKDLKVSGLSTKVSAKGEVLGVDFNFVISLNPNLLKVKP